MIVLGQQNKMALVFFHGMLGRSEDWLPIAERLSTEYGCYLPNLPAPNAENFSDYLTQLVKWSVEVLPDTFVLVGYSMGARLALALSQRITDRVQALILESVHPGLTHQQQREDRLHNDQYWQTRFETENAESVLSDWYHQPVFRDLTDEQRQSLIQQRSQQSLEQWADWFPVTGLAKQPDLRQWLAKFSKPLLMLSGEQDTKFLQLQTSMSLINNNIESVVIPKAGHLGHWQQPDFFVQTLNNFLQRRLFHDQ